MEALLAEPAAHGRLDEVELRLFRAAARDRVIGDFGVRRVRLLHDRLVATLGNGREALRLNEVREAHEGNGHDRLFQVLDGHCRVLVIGRPLLRAAIAAAQAAEREADHGLHARVDAEDLVPGGETRRGRDAHEVGAARFRQFQNFGFHVSQS